MEEDKNDDGKILTKTKKFSPLSKMKVNQQIQEPIEEEQSSFEMQGKFSSSSLVKHQESNLS